MEIPEGMSELEWLQMEQEKEMIMAAMNASLHEESSNTSLLNTSSDHQVKAVEEPPTSSTGGGNGISELEWLQMEQEKEMIMAAMRESLNASSSTGLVHLVEDEKKEEVVPAAAAQGGGPTTAAASASVVPPNNGMSELEWLQMPEKKAFALPPTNQFQNLKLNGSSSSISSNRPSPPSQQHHAATKRGINNNSTAVAGGRTTRGSTYNASSAGTTTRPGAVGISHVSSGTDHKEWEAKMNAKLHNFKVKQQNTSKCQG